MVRGWSSTQAVIVLTSGEVEYYAAVEGASAALGFKSMLKDLGIIASIRLVTDSSAATSITLVTDSNAARGMIHRAWLGKLRRLETGFLWLQAAVKHKRLQVRKVLGTGNPGDVPIT